MRNFETELVREIVKCEKKSAEKTRDILNSSYIIYYSRIPQVDNIKPESFKKLTTHEKIELCLELIEHSQVSEVVTWALHRLYEFYYSYLLEHKSRIILLSSIIENWWHADDLSRIYAYILDNHKAVLAELQKWAKSGEEWQKRLSLTSLIYYSSKPKNPLQSTTILSQIELLLDEESYYVQKGLGWTLRETYSLYPQETLQFMRVYAKLISSVAFSPAIEKVSEEEKKELKYLRKKEVSNTYYFEDSI